MTAKIKLNAASGGGSVSVQAPASSSNNRVITLPDISDGTLVTSQSTLDATKLSGNLPAISGASLTGVGKLLKIHSAKTTTAVHITTPSRGDTGLAITFTPEALGSTFFIHAYQFGRNGATNDSSFFRLFLMREIASGTASELESWIYLGSDDHTKDYDIWPIVYKDSPSYSSGQTLNYHLEVGFYTGNYALNFKAQDNSVASRIFVHEIGA